MCEESRIAQKKRTTEFWESKYTVGGVFAARGRNQSSMGPRPVRTENTGQGPMLRCSTLVLKL